MEIENLKNKQIRKVVVTIRTFPNYSKWMKENDISPSKVFNQAVKDLMEKK